MGKKPGSFRTTISVPANLKARMDKVQDPVNWSALACRAFQDKLAEIAAKKVRKTMSDVVERLRASLREQRQGSVKLGYVAGKAWAENNASAAQLQRLAAFQISAEREGDGFWEAWFMRDHHSGAFGPGELLVREIEGDERLGRQEMVAFWEQILGDDEGMIHDDEFARGFAEGAIDLWAAVKQML